MTEATMTAAGALALAAIAAIREASPPAIKTGADLLAIRRSLGLSQSDLASALRIHGTDAARTVRRWERAPAVPGPVAVAVEALATRIALDRSAAVPGD